MGKYSLLGLGALALVACGADAVDARPDGGSAPALAPITLSGNWHASCAIAEGGALYCWGDLSGERQASPVRSRRSVLSPASSSSVGRAVVAASLKSLAMNCTWPENGM